MKLYWLFSLGFWCQASTSRGLFWVTFHGDPDKTQGGEGGQWCESGSHEEDYGAVYYSGHPAFVDELFLSSARGIKVLEAICFIVSVRIVCKRKATLCFNDKGMLLIKPS